jgi:mRNA-degrading endonuclease RelE of RelBE toxin-antitoxin system
MEQEPFFGDVIPLKGPYAGSYRRRVGPWRILFTLSWDSQIVGIADIAPHVDDILSRSVPVALLLARADEVIE